MTKYFKTRSELRESGWRIEKHEGHNMFRHPVDDFFISVDMLKTVGGLTEEECYIKHGEYIYHADMFIDREQTMIMQSNDDSFLKNVLSHAEYISHVKALLYLELNKWNLLAAQKHIQTLIELDEDDERNYQTTTL